MNKTLSIYLDLVRFLSALLVFFFHAKFARFDGQWLKGVGVYGYDAVIIFFVLSGFVIAYVSNNKEKTINAFSKSRFARLYSVVVPALFLTLIADSIGKLIDPSMYIGDHYQNSQPVIRFFTNILFVNEIWFYSWRAFSNGPFWSLSYEFWYYVIYAVFFYLSGWKRFVFAVIAFLIAGPKIIILLPVWFLGVGVYHLSNKIILPRFTSICLVVLPFVVYFLYREMHVNKYLLRETVEFLGQDFGWSRRFINDYIVGILFSAHILGVSSIAKNLTFPSLIDRPIKYFAGVTFSLYLFHYPLLQLYGSIFKNGIIIVVLTFMSVILLAPITEGKKKEWKKIVEGVAGLTRRPSRTQQSCADGLKR